MPESHAGGATVDTIFAPATGAGRAAVAIVRISGPAAHWAIEVLTGASVPPWRMLTLKTIRTEDNAVLDQAMVVVFPAGASYTGEAMAEVHCHGGPAVLSDLLDRLASLAGLRPAEPGEFTRRALMAGRMDLTEVEGLADLIAAETTAQRRQALRLQGGAVSRLVSGWRERLLRVRALLEVTIDWVDEELPTDLASEVLHLLSGTISDMESELVRSGPAERLRSGFEVAIVGAPNAGKSSLLNAIAGRDAAIVSDIAGTTRDVLEVRYDLRGVPVTFLDTAGLRQTSDPVESLGVKRALARAEAADLRILIRAADADGDVDGICLRQGDILVWGKSDLGAGDGDLSISVRRQEGVDALLDLVWQRLAPGVEAAGLFGSSRQRHSVELAYSHLRRCRDRASSGPAEVAAEELRLAMLALDRVVGRVGVEDVLGEIFAGFCLGK